VVHQIPSHQLDDYRVSKPFTCSQFMKHVQNQISKTNLVEVEMRHLLG